jgi:hypothetical protein
MCAVNSETKSSRNAPPDFSPLLKAPHARLLSSDALRILNAKLAPRPPEPGRAPGQQKRTLVRQIPAAPAAPGIPANVLVNNPADDVAFGNQTTQSEPSLAVSRVGKHPRFLADLTGNGRADIVGFGDAGVWTALSNGDGTFQEPHFVVANFGYEADGVSSLRTSWSASTTPRQTRVFPAIRIPPTRSRLSMMTAG